MNLVGTLSAENTLIGKEIIPTWVKPIKGVDYFTEEDIEEIISQLSGTIPEKDIEEIIQRIEQDGFASQEWVIAKIQENTTDFARKTDIPDVSGYVTTENLQNYAKIADIQSEFAKKSEIPDVSDYLTQDSLQNYAKLTDIPDTSSFITMPQVEAKGYQTATQVNTLIEAKGYQTQAQVNTLINSALGVIENGAY